MIESALDRYGYTPERVVRFVAEGHELGLGYMLATVLRGEAYYPVEWGEWIVWHGTYWRRDIGGHHIRRLMEERLAPLLEEALGHYRQALQELQGADTSRPDIAAEKSRIEADIKVLQAGIKKIRSRAGGENVIAMATACQRDISLDISATTLDLHPCVISTANVVLNMRTGLPIDLDVNGRCQYRATKAAPTEWHGLEAPREQFERFIAEIFDSDSELIAFVQRLFGYIASGLATEHIFPIFQGGGRNGKSALIKIISTVLGEDIAGPVNTELLYVQQNRSSTGPSPDIRSLHGRRFAFASEASHNKRLDTARIKWLTGGDDLIARAPHETREFRWRPTHTLILVTNPLPPLDHVDFAFTKRLLFIPFSVSFVDAPNPQKPHERKCDPHITDRICRDEGPGVLAWIVEGFLRYLTEGLSPPDKVKAATAQYIQEEDLIAYFLQQTTQEDPRGFVLSRDLYAVFRRWMIEDYGANEKEIMSSKSLGRFVRQLFHAERDKRTGNRGFAGLTLNKRGEELFLAAQMED